MKAAASVMGPLETKERPFQRAPDASHPSFPVSSCFWHPTPRSQHPSWPDIRGSGWRARACMAWAAKVDGIGSWSEHRFQPPLNAESRGRGGRAATSFVRPVDLRAYSEAVSAEYLSVEGTWQAHVGIRRAASC
eukprot:2626071-Rhodomonas_salina.1